MKKVILASIDRSTDPTFTAKRCVEIMQNDVVTLRRIAAKWDKQILKTPENDLLMNNIIDSCEYIHEGIEDLLEHYYKVLYTSKQ